MDRNYIKLGFVTMLLMSIIMACNNNELYKEKVLIMKSKPINVTKEKMQLVYSGIKDTIPQSDINKTNNLLWVIYADSFVCSSCKLGELQFWNEFIYRTKKKYDNVDFCFIFSPKEEDKNMFMFTMKSLTFASSIYLDSLRTFPKNNPQIPKDHRFHTFLLDKNRNIILIGDPIKNDRINELFLETT
mgnify:CR=1 FL=1